MTPAAPAPPGSHEADFFRALNALVEPAVRAGLGAPVLWPTGLILLETTGRASGQPRRVPLVATVLEGCVFTATVRGPRSQWMQNLAANPRARCWIAGAERSGRALLFAPGAPPPALDGLPPTARAVAEGLVAPATRCGWSVAVIVLD